MLENQIDYDERLTKEMSYTGPVTTFTQKARSIKKKGFSFFSQLNFGDFVTEMMGTACTGFVVHTKSVNQSKSAGQ